ncbi:MAG: hypothetical protein IKF90_13725 [Parasporobacterium sp.]|nr:hypothetical protein [Parasporobacterium sp.]
MADFKLGRGRHMSNRYDSLRYLEGAEVKLISGIRCEESPDEVIIVKDYPKTVLIRMRFTRSIWGLQIPPRYIYQMVAKASMACGDVRMKTLEGDPLYGDGITAILTDEEAII